MKKWSRLVVFLVVLLGFVWVMMWGVGQSHKEQLAKTTQQLEELNSMSPEQYYDKTKQGLLKRKELNEKLAESYKEGTSYAIYRAIRDMPEAIVALTKHLTQ